MSNLKVAKLIMVAVNDEESVKKGNAKQNNKYYHMFERDGGTFDVEFGRVDSTCQTTSYPMSKWDSTIKSKIKKGYKDVTHLFAELDESSTPDRVVGIADTKVNKLFTSLQNYANKSIQENYNVSSAKVTQKMIDEAQSYVNDLVNHVKTQSTVAAFNKTLLDLYHVIPRKMGNVQTHLVPDKNGLTLSDSTALKRAEELVESEQSTLDVMAGQVSINTKTDEDSTPTEKKTILDILGLQVELASDADIKMIKEMMGPNARQFKSAYVVKNKATQSKFEKQVDQANNKKTELLWHGSRNQNWLNIISTGLLIRPAGAIHTGSMFGDGIYHSNVCQKSIGYTSLSGSYWAKGSDKSAYLALYSVHVGNQKHITRHNSSHYKLCYSVIQQEGCDSVYAHGGADLRNDEFITYQAQQCTISYLVEISN